MTYDADDVDQNAEGEEEEDLLRARMYVRMATLVELDGAYHANDVHEAGVELKVVVAGTDVVGGGEDALHDEADAHCVEEAEMLRHAVRGHDERILLAHVGVRVGALLDHDDEHDAEQDVADIAEHVVEGGEVARLDHAQEVEVARVLVARLGQLLIEIEKSRFSSIN